VSRLKHIAEELKHHAPFTALGACLGVAVMAVVSLGDVAQTTSHNAFHVLHPAHMLLSATVTAAMFRRHGGGAPAAITVGLVGAVGICAISDIVLPHAGGALLGARMSLHVCLVEHPWLVIVPGLIGAAIGSLARFPTRCPHAVHVSISTLASLFYLMAFGVTDWVLRFPLVFVVLFLAVWIPCCTSDIVFPILFTKIKHH
jgi:hypothetical protein